MIVNQICTWWPTSLWATRPSWHTTEKVFIDLISMPHTAVISYPFSIHTFCWLFACLSAQHRILGLHFDSTRLHD